MKRHVLYAAVLGSLLLPTVAGASTTTPDVAVDTVYYNYIEKLSGMGYIKSMPNGAKPYSRQQMAQWVKEAEDKAATKPMPAYLQSQFNALKDYLAPELAVLNGEELHNPLHVTSATLGYAYNHSDQMHYRYVHNKKDGNVRSNVINGHYQPFGTGNNGYDNGRGSNYLATFRVEGNLTKDIAVSAQPRWSYDKDNSGKLSLEEGYIKGGIGAWDLLFGKEAMIWGQGASGNLLLGNSMKPLTTFRVQTKKPQKIGGFFRFLGEVDVHAFYGELEGNRRDVAAQLGGKKEFDHPGLLGLRVDVTPTNYFTIGASRISMIGGDGNALNHSDWSDWFTGTNAYFDDKWNDIAGFDFRLRLPGVQFYGELYGEDQAGYLPSQVGYRFGTYLPNLADNGAWDMTLEIADTGRNWYRHGTFQNGWTYSGHILGDPMGRKARSYYARVNHYLPNETTLGLYAKRTEMERDIANYPIVNEVALTGQYKLRSDVYLRGTLGYAQVKHAEGTNTSDNSVFAGTTVEWMF